MSGKECAWVGRDEVFEDYARGTLGGRVRDAFEAHYFECDACFRRARAVLELRAGLAALPAGVPAPQPARGRKRWWALAPVAATCVLAAAGFLWFRNPARPASPALVAGAPPATAPVMPPSTGPAAPSSAATSSSVSAPAAKAEAPQPPASAVVAMSALVHVDPPLYVPVVLRGPRDEGAEQFEAAMRLYRTGDYAGALEGLHAADAMNPDRPRTRFFLAVSQLLLGQNSDAAASFERTIALGESPYLEEAHFYLAKAWLRLGRLPAARRELQQAIARHGGLAEEARQLIAQIDALAAGKDRPPDN
jgi:tetratricopeptide (TPR) repeat protein